MRTAKTSSGRPGKEGAAVSLVRGLRRKRFFVNGWFVEQIAGWSVGRGVFDKMVAVVLTGGAIAKLPPMLVAGSLHRRDECPRVRVPMLEEMDKPGLGKHAQRALHRADVEHNTRAFFHDRAPAGE